MSTRSYEPLRKISWGHFSLNDFVKLKAWRRTPLACITHFFLQELSIFLELYTQLDARVEELDDQIEECVRSIDPPMLSIPGIGAFSTAVILSEYGDFSKFRCSSKMLAFAGLEPGYFQSGQSESTGHMVKHGSPHLRCAMLNCCLPLVSNEPVFAEYYAKKRAEGKTHQVAMTYVAKSSCGW